uniref:ATP synthase F0 subunit 8 n=1 Tax=Lispe neimongola TaxID=2032846 RepID=UPI002A7EB768|nr:ATP synthase F0 subunit 8 [Lispe neimongola]WOE90337.1 ATP synthase F0 subunit 8 [Lispe neimongola]
MPQMAPIGWLSLFFIFSVTFLLFCMMNYYTFIPSSTQSNNMKNLKFNSMNWKW